MKKILILFLALLFFAGCAAAPKGDIVEIGERFFLTRITDIVTHADNYEGRTVRFEGMFYAIHWDVTNRYHHYVVRRTYGCCGDDGYIGFEVELGDIPPPPEDAWVEVTGILTRGDADGTSLLVVDVTSITELATRGAEFVSE